MENNKTGKYFKYAIGEIALVVIGILIALSINNWNQSENLSKKELALLVNLRNDVDADIISLKQQDSLYSILEAKAKTGINLFYMAKTIKDIDSVSSLTNGLWNELFINQNTYNEMISSGNMYTMKNKGLQKIITRYYLNVDANRFYLRDVNKVQSQLFELTPEIYPYKLLISQLNNPQIDINSIDTTWINNPKTPTYLAVITYLNSNQELNNKMN